MVASKRNRPDPFKDILKQILDERVELRQKINIIDNQRLQNIAVISIPDQCIEAGNKKTLSAG